MSKSLGNYIEPAEVVDKWGADTFRYYAIGGAAPGLDLNYNHDDAKLKHKNLLVLWNIQNFVLDLAKELNANPAETDETMITGLFDIEERFIFSKLNSTIKKVTEFFDTYRLSDAPREIEELLLTLSRSYIQMVREKAALGDPEERKVVLFAVYHVLTECIKLFAPVAPFIAEQIWQNLREEFEAKEESVHLCSWPRADEKEINPELEKNIATVEGVIQQILAARERAKISVRWPIKSVEIVSEDESVRKAVELLEDVIQVQTNIKDVHSHTKFPEIKETIKANVGALGKSFGKQAPTIMAKLATVSASDVISKLAQEGKFALKLNKESVELTKDHIIIERVVPPHYVMMEFKGGVVYLDTTRTEELEHEGFAREIMRRVQSLRKKAGLEKTHKIQLYLKADERLAKALQPWQARISEKCGAQVCKISALPPAKKHAHSSEETIKDKALSIFFDVLK
jgi:isoleucyl-tRNA synthetase